MWMQGCWAKDVCWINDVDRQMPEGGALVEGDYLVMAMMMLRMKNKQQNKVMTHVRVILEAQLLILVVSTLEWFCLVMVLPKQANHLQHDNSKLGTCCMVSNSHKAYNGQPNGKANSRSNFLSLH